MIKPNEVAKDCYPPDDIQTDTIFILPPLQAKFYQKNNAAYQAPPSYHPDCSVDEENPLAFLYPRTATLEITLPEDFGNEKQTAIFECTHTKENMKVYWYLDGEYIGFTSNFHKMEIAADRGEHFIVATDQNGYSLGKKLIVS